MGVQWLLATIVLHAVGCSEVVGDRSRPWPGGEGATCLWWSWEISHSLLCLQAQRAFSRLVTPTSYAKPSPNVLREP